MDLTRQSRMWLSSPEKRLDSGAWARRTQKWMRNWRKEPVAPALAATRWRRSGAEGSRPVSRVLSRTAIHLRRASPRASSDLPGDARGPRAAALRLHAPLFGLAPGGVYPAADVANGAVRSYRTISPLPLVCRRTGERGWRCIFCGTFRGLAPPRRYLAPCPMEPGLSSPPASGRSGCPADSPAQSNRIGLDGSGTDQGRARFGHLGLSAGGLSAYLHSAECCVER